MSYNPNSHREDFMRMDGMVPAHGDRGRNSMAGLSETERRSPWIVVATAHPRSSLNRGAIIGRPLMVPAA